MSLAPLLRGGTQPRRDALYWHYPHYSNQGGVPSGAIREGDWKLIELCGDGRLELYNLKRDLGETQNLVLSEARLSRQLQTKLHLWLKQVDTAMPDPNSNYVPAEAGQGLTGVEKRIQPAF